jgi:incFII family plasmid replication initiator RepA
MAKAEGFTSRFDFSIHVAFLRSLGKRHRMPPLLRRRAIDALLQAMCFHYDPLANRVQFWPPSPGAATCQSAVPPGR